MSVYCGLYAKKKFENVFLHSICNLSDLIISQAYKVLGVAEKNKLWISSKIESESLGNVKQINSAIRYDSH